MDAVAAGHSPPTLRLYSWSGPVVILGVGQPSADIDLDACRDSGFEVLRRIGGGTAVYHDEDEVSIDLILPYGHPLALTDVHAGYEMFAGLLSRSLGRMRIDVETVSIEQARQSSLEPEMRPICFASVSPYEFEVDGRKLNGLCQIRRRNVVTYQTAIYRRFQIEPLLRALLHESPEVREVRRARLNQSVTDLATIGNGRFDYSTFQSHLTNAATEGLGLNVRHGSLSVFEADRTAELVAEKYGNPDWTFRR
jgi:lipoyl(octanoyl) transferase